MNEEKNKRSRLSESFVQKFVKRDSILKKAHEEIEDLDFSVQPRADRYKIIEEIGRGGMGIVYKAYDTALKRTVALKFINTVHITQKSDFQRFVREAKATAKMRHPNIITVYDIGQDQGRPFFAMDFAEGRTLKQTIKSSRLSIRKMVNLMIKIGAAVHYAHAKGVIHRDIKPSNILLNKKGEPLIMDFGLAKISKASTKLSKSGAIIGTLQYMPPEQSQGYLHKIDERSDVYALGATLYELLTGVPPMLGGTTLQMLYNILNKEPVPPGKLNPQIPRELASICLKALEKKKGKRYPTASAFVEDLENFLEHKPVKAQPATIFTYLQKLFLRYRMLSSAVLLCVAMSATFSFFQWRRAAKALEGEKQAQKLAEKLRIQLKQTRENITQKTIRAQKIRLAKAVLARARVENNWAKCGVLAGEASELVKDMQGEDAEGIKKQCTHMVWLSLENTSIWKQRAAYPIYASAYSPDGKILATGSDKIHLWKGDSGEYLCQLGGDSASYVQSLAFSADGKVLASSEATVVKLWDVKAKILIRKLEGHSARIYSLNFHPRDMVLASASEDKTVRLWRVDGEKSTKVLRGHKKTVPAVVFSPDGKMLASASFDRTIRLWSYPGGDTIKILQQHKYGICSVAFHPSGKLLASASSKEDYVYLWNIPSGEAQIVQDLKFGAFVSFSPDGKILACAGWDKNVYLSKENTVRQLKHSTILYSTTFSRDGNKIISNCNDAVARLWDIASGSLVHESALPVKSLCFNPNGDILATVCGGESIYTYNANSGKRFRTYNIVENHSTNKNYYELTSLVFHPDGKHIAIRSSEKDVYLWNLISGKKFKLKNTNGDLLCFSPDGKILAITREATKIVLWDVHKKQEICTYHAHNAKITALQFSSDGKTLVSASRDSTVKLWQIVAGEKIQGKKFAEIPAPVKAMCMSKKLVAVAYRNKIGIWDFATHKCVGNLPRHTADVLTMCFSPHGRLIASASNNTVRLWHVASRSPVKVFYGHNYPVKLVKFSPRGNAVVSLSSNGSVRMWPILKRNKPGLLSHTELVLSTAFRPDGKFLASIAQNATLWVWKVATTELIAKIALPGNRILSYGCVKFTPDGHVACAYNRELTICSPSTNKIIRRFSLLRKDCITACAFSPAGKYLVCSSLDNALKLWELNSGKCIRVFYGHAGRISCVKFDNKGDYFASCGMDQKIIVWQVASGKPFRVFHGHKDAVNSIHINANKLLASGTNDHPVRLWNISSGKLKNTFTVRANQVVAFGFSNDGRTLVSASNDKIVRLWDVTSGKPGEVFIGHRVSNICFRPDGKMLALSSGKKVVLYHVPERKRGGRTFTLAPIIDNGLKKEPRKITQYLFDMEVGDNFSFTPSKVRLWD